MMMMMMMMMMIIIISSSSSIIIIITIFIYYHDFQIMFISLSLSSSRIFAMWKLNLSFHMCIE